jgi:SAM-dependent methyltransferase
MAEIDFDHLAAGYQHRPPSGAALLRARRAAEAANLGPGRLAVDVGGGPGHHAAEFAATGAAAIVVDLSSAMAAAARAHAGVRAVVGDGRRLPLLDGVADLVYLHLSLQYGDWRMMLDEAVRVTRAAGLIVVWSLARTHFAESFLARWFPSVAGIDEARFPDPAAVVARLAHSGLVGVEASGETETVTRRAGEWRRAVEGRFVSTLQMLDAEELRAGLAAFSAAHPDDEELLRYRLEWRRVMGRVAG